MGQLLGETMGIPWWRIPIWYYFTMFLMCFSSWLTLLIPKMVIDLFTVSLQSWLIVYMLYIQIWDTCSVQAGFAAWWRGSCILECYPCGRGRRIGLLLWMLRWGGTQRLLLGMGTLVSTPKLLGWRFEQTGEMYEISRFYDMYRGECSFELFCLLKLSCCMGRRTFRFPRIRINFEDYLQ